MCQKRYYVVHTAGVFNMWFGVKGFSVAVVDKLIIFSFCYQCNVLQSCVIRCKFWSTGVHDHQVCFVYEFGWFAQTNVVALVVRLFYVNIFCLMHHAKQIKNIHWLYI